MNMKVVGTGLGKTGTKTLKQALELLGYRTIHLPRSIEEIDAYDAACDNSVAVAFRELDERYPDARFIHTSRCLDDWIASWQRHDQRIRHYGRRSLPDWLKQVRIRAFGQAEFNAEMWTQAYVQHEQAVLEHFKDRPEKLLFLKICEGDGWAKLCPFLDKPIPAVAFPWQNQAPPAFVFCFYQHDVSLAIRLTRQIRKFYRTADIIAIADGTDSPEFAAVADELKIHHLIGERLKTPDRGGAWLRRLFQAALNYSSAQRIVKIEPDTFLHRAFLHWPDAPVAGTLQPDPDVPFVRGGCVYFNRSVLPRLIEALGNPKFVKDRSSYQYKRFKHYRWPNEPEVNEWVTCCDRILWQAMLDCGVKGAGWSEICCNFRSQPPNNAEKLFAATHPVR